MNANLPQLDLPRDYVVGNDITEAILNFYKQTCRLKAGIFALCVEGNLRASINLTEYTLKPNDFIGFSSEFMDCVNMIKSTMSALPTIYENPIISLSEDRAYFINDYFHLLERVQAKEKSINREMVKHILLTMIHGISDLYQGKSWPNKITTRSDEIHKKFIQLVMKNYTSKRQTAFYASQLSISPQHLCMIIKQKTGRSVSDIIADMIIMDAKSQLMATDLTIQEISYSLNFPNVSFFGKYFKRYVGVSPQKFRNS